MKKRSKRKHAPEVKAAAMAALLAGQSVSQVAKKYKIPKGTVSNWKRRGPSDGTQKKAIGKLLEELMEAELQGLVNAAKVTGSEEWLKKQDAPGLGVFVGIKYDKMMRMLEAMDQSAES